MTDTTTTMDTIDERLAATSAELLKATLTLARQQHATDPETVAEIDGLTACRLIVTAVGPQVQLELVGTTPDGVKRFYGVTCKEEPLQ